MLLTETVSLRLEEAKITKLENNRRRVERAKGQHCNVENKNKRRYPLETTWGKHVVEGTPFMNRIANREVFGHIEHPEDGRSDLNKAAIHIEKAWMEGEEVFLTFSSLSTRPGQTITSLIDDKLNFGLSSRATGTVTKAEDGVDEVQEDFEPETWDCVADPSVGDARVVEEVRKRLIEACEGGKCAVEKKEKEELKKKVLMEDEKPASDSADEGDKSVDVEVEGKDLNEAKSALVVASELGYPYLDVSVHAIEGGIVYNYFTKDRARKGPGVYVGLDHATGKWDIVYDKDWTGESLREASSMWNQLKPYVSVVINATMGLEDEIRGARVERGDAIVAWQAGFEPFAIAVRFEGGQMNAGDAEEAAMEYARKHMRGTGYETTEPDYVVMESAGTSRIDEQGFRAGKRHLVNYFPPDLEFIEEDYPSDVWKSVEWNKDTETVTVEFEDKETAQAIQYAINKKEPRLRTKIRSIPSKGIIRMIITGGRYWNEAEKEEEMGKRLTEAAKVIPTNNRSLGFWGTIMSNAQGELANRDTQKIWDAMFRALSKKERGAPSEAIRNFLDSAYGRHLADSLGNNAASDGDPDALIAAIEQTLAGRHVLKSFLEIIRATEKGEYMESKSMDTGKDLSEKEVTNEATYYGRVYLNRKDLKTFSDETGLEATEDNIQGELEGNFGDAAADDVEVSQGRHGIILEFPANSPVMRGIRSFLKAYRLKIETFEKSDKPSVEAVQQKKKTVITIDAQEVPGAMDTLSAKDIIEDLLANKRGFDVTVTADEDANALTVVVNDDTQEGDVADVISALGIALADPDEEIAAESTEARKRPPQMPKRAELGSAVFSYSMAYKIRVDLRQLGDLTIQQVKRAAKKGGTVASVTDGSFLLFFVEHEWDADKIKDAFTRIGMLEEGVVTTEEDVQEDVEVKEKKLSELKREKFRADCARYLEIEEATKKIIERLTSRNKELEKALNEMQEKIGVLEEMNRTMDDLKRLEELSREQDRLIAETPDLEKAAHLLSKAETIDELKRTAKELVHFLKQDKSTVVKEEKKGKTQTKKSDIIKDESTVVVDSSKDLTEGADALSRLTQRYTTKR